MPLLIVLIMYHFHIRGLLQCHNYAYILVSCNIFNSKVRKKYIHTGWHKKLYTKKKIFSFFTSCFLYNHLHRFVFFINCIFNLFRYLSNFPTHHQYIYIYIFLWDCYIFLDFRFWRKFSKKKKNSKKYHHYQVHFTLKWYY